MELEKTSITEIKDEMNRLLTQYQEIMMKEAMETRKISVNMIHRQKQTITANVPRFNFFMTLCTVYTMLQVVTYLIWQYHPQDIKELLSFLFLGKLVDALTVILK